MSWSKSQLSLAASINLEYAQNSNLDIRHMCCQPPAKHPESYVSVSLVAWE